MKNKIIFWLSFFISYSSIESSCPRSDKWYKEQNRFGSYVVSQNPEQQVENIIESYNVSFSLTDKQKQTLRDGGIVVVSRGTVNMGASIAKEILQSYRIYMAKKKIYKINYFNLKNIKI